MLSRAQPILTPPRWAWAWDAAGQAALRSVTVSRARDASAEGLRHLARDACAQLFADVTSAGFPHVVRMWNFIPDLHATLDDGEDRYMAFNAGRHDAMIARHGPALASHLPSATGVGHGGSDLILFALARATPGQPVENALQIPAYRYSRRYGRLPPCFARATRTDLGLLVSGTAAIRGEETRSAGNLAAQLAITMENLACLTAGQRISAARAYVPASSDVPEVRAACEHLFGELEIFEADLCRRDLLVEIEGIVLSVNGR